PYYFICRDCSAGFDYPDPRLKRKLCPPQKDRPVYLADMVVRYAVRCNCVRDDGPVLLILFRIYFSIFVSNLLSAMKSKYVLMLAGCLALILIGPEVMAQCSICTKTAAEL